jgi:hypothetical protein
MSFAPELTLDELYISNTFDNGRMGLDELFTIHNPVDAGGVSGGVLLLLPLLLVDVTLSGGSNKSSG